MIVEVVCCTVSVTLLFALYWFSKTSNKKSTLTAEGIELSRFEQYYHHVYRKYKVVVTALHVIESTEPLSDDDALQALGILQRRHPLLRMRIREKKDYQGTRCFYEEMKAPTITYRREKLIASDKDDLQEAFRRQLLSTFDCESGPLWNVCRLEESRDNKSGLVVNCFIFSFHHAIIDGFSRIRLFDEFLDVLDKQYRGEYVDTQSLQMLPNLETLFKRDIEVNWYQKLLIQIKARLIAWGIVTRGQNAVEEYFSKFPPLSDRNPDIEKETIGLFHVFDRNETQRILASCKERGCTLNAAFMAASSMALAEILHEAEASQEYCIPVSCAVSLRKHNTYDSAVDLTKGLGAYLGFLGFKSLIQLKTDEGSADIFHRLSRKLTNDTRAMIRSNMHINHFKFYLNISGRVLFCKMHETRCRGNIVGRFGATLHFLSNNGRLQQEDSVKRTFEVSQIFAGVYEALYGPLFTSNYMTVNGQLCVTTLHHKNITSLEQIHDFRSRTFAYLTMGI